MAAELCATGASAMERIDTNYLGTNLLVLLGIDDPAVLRINNPWQRKGSETYATDFWVERNGSEQHLIAKACIKFYPKETMHDWLARRRVVEAHGVAVPKLHAVDGATLVEEYVPFTLKQAYVCANSDTRETLKHAFIITYRALVGAGFSATGLHDARSRGDDVVVIDFGEDLGPPVQTTPKPDFFVAAEAEKCFRQAVT